LILINPKKKGIVIPHASAGSHEADILIINLLMQKMHQKNSIGRGELFKTIIVVKVQRCKGTLPFGHPAGYSSRCSDNCCWF